MSDELDYAALSTGPNTVTAYKNKAGKTFYMRSGSRSERNKIEEKFNDITKPMDAVAAMMYYRLCDVTGAPHYRGRKFTDVTQELNYDSCTEMALIVRKREEIDEDEVHSLDDETEAQIKNSEALQEDI